MFNSDYRHAQDNETIRNYISSYVDQYPRNFLSYLLVRTCLCLILVKDVVDICTASVCIQLPFRLELKTDNEIT